jgi:hypothetical protein
MNMRGVTMRDMSVRCVTMHGMTFLPRGLLLGTLSAATR